MSAINEYFISSFDYLSKCCYCFILTPHIFLPNNYLLTYINLFIQETYFYDLLIRLLIYVKKYWRNNGFKIIIYFFSCVFVYNWISYFRSNYRFAIFLIFKEVFLLHSNYFLEVSAKNTLFSYMVNKYVLGLWTIHYMIRWIKPKLYELSQKSCAKRLTTIKLPGCNVNV